MNKDSKDNSWMPEPANPVPGEWSEPEELEGSLLPVESFREELLPESFRPLVCDTAERMCTPLDFPGVVSILTLAGTVNRRAVIEPMANDVTWLVTPNLWGGLVARPGEMKSPLIEAICAPVRNIQGIWQREYDDEMATFAQSNAEHLLRIRAWEQQYVHHCKNPDRVPKPIHPGDGWPKPVFRRIIVNDPTPEALHAILAENPSGVLLIRDELTGWFSELDKPGREGARAFYLEAWTGNSTFTVDRIGRGTVHASLCISILGGIQPNRLVSYLSDAVRSGPGDDGLMQRFQLLVWPDAVPWKGVDRMPDHAAAKRVEHAFRNLVQMDSETPARFKFSSDAQELFDAFRESLEKVVRGKDDHPALVSHLSKYRSLMPSLALLFELADRSSKSTNFEVSLSHAAQAVEWCKYLETHARRIYGCIAAPRIVSARELGIKIKQGKLGREFTARDVYRKGWACLDSGIQTDQAIEALADAGWIRPAPVQPDKHTGRSDRPRLVLYEVNPAVWNE